MVHHRSLFISDLHIGTLDCNAEQLIQFLTDNTADTTYLVGDIIDIWAMRKQVHLSEKQITVIALLIDRAKKGHRTVYVLGNHDWDLRHLCGSQVENIEIVDEIVHTTQRGEKILVTHGHDFEDHTTARSKVLGWLYNVVRSWSRMLDRCSTGMGMRPPALLKRLKNRSRRVERYITEYAENLTSLVHAEGHDGVVCGHIHGAAIHKHKGFLYMNTGDWTGSNTAIVEDHEGDFHLLVGEGSAFAR